MEQSLELLKSIARNWNTCAKGFDIIEDAIDEISRKKNVGLSDVITCALKIGAGGFITYVSADGIKQNVAQLISNIEATNQPTITEQKTEVYNYSPGLFSLGFPPMNNMNGLYNASLYGRLSR